MSKTTDTFGARLARLREAAGLSVQQLGERAGLSRQHVWRLEQEISEPSLDAARKLAEALGKPLSVWE